MTARKYEPVPALIYAVVPPWRPGKQVPASADEETARRLSHLELQMDGRTHIEAYRRATVTREEVEAARSLVRSYSAGTLNVHLNGGEAYGFVAAVAKALGLEVSDE